MSGARREAQGAFVNLLTLLAQAALPAFHVQLARLLGAGGYGTYAWSNMVVDLFSIVTLFGMDQAVTRAVSLAVAKDDPAAIARAVGTGLRMVVLSGAVVAVAIFMLAPMVAGRQGEPQAVIALRVLTLVPIFYHATTMLLAATQAKSVMRHAFWARGVAQPLLLLTLTTVLLRLGGGVGAACASVATAMGLTAVLAAVFYGREFSLRDMLRHALTGEVDRGLLRFVAPLVATSFVWALQGRIDALVLRGYRGSAELGHYAACILYVASVSQARCALVVLFAGFAEPLLTVFGRGFASGATAMAILTVGHAVNAISLASFAVPLSGHPHYGTVAAVVCVILQAILLPILVPRFGLVGAATSASFALVVAQTLQMTFAWRLVRVHGFSRGLLKVTAASVAALLVGRGAYAVIGGPLLARFLVGLALAAACYLVSLVILGLETEERDAVRALAGRARAITARRCR